jgi:hypothetical protein
MPLQLAVQKESLMSNAMKIMSLVAAVLVTAAIHGSLLWKMNDVATQARPEIRYVTLEPVTVVGRHEALMPEQVMAQATTPSSATQGPPSHLVE